MQRALTDFGAEESFASATTRIKEHYGVIVASSTTRLDVEKHAACMRFKESAYYHINMPKNAKVIIAETDGAMLPTVLPGSGPDKRKNKTYEWKEARLTLARVQGHITPFVGAIVGPPNEVGDKLAETVRRAGEYEKTKVHCIGDGAPWIAEQVERIFGIKANFLLDFYHVSEYLAKAALCCEPSDTKSWLREQQTNLKNSKSECVCNALEEHISKKCCTREECPAKICYNYLSKRLNQLNYQDAIISDLPIGSGEIESAHRYISQKRLKISGAWWHLENVKHMLALRTARANGQWENYWAFLSPSQTFQATS